MVTAEIIAYPHEVSQSVLSFKNNPPNTHQVNSNTTKNKVDNVVEVTAVIQTTEGTV